MFEVNLLGFDIVKIFKDNALHMAGLCSAFLSIAAFYPYARDTWCGHTSPQRASWFIWSVLSSISFLSVWAEGSSAALWFVFVQCAGTIVIFLLSLKHGTGSLFRASDFTIVATATVGLVLWFLTQDPVYALAVSISISAVGGIATVRKSYLAPDTETRVTWSLLFFASLLGTLSVGTVDWMFLAYPIYLSLLYGAVLAAMTLGRTRSRRISHMTLRRISRNT